MAYKICPAGQCNEASTNRSVERGCDSKKLEDW